jgi:hypothetical protein
MAGNTGAIQAGLTYQELYGWYRVLDLKSPSGRVRSVSIEDPKAGFFDDVVVRPAPSTEHAHEYLQIKFHVDVSDVYSSDSFMTENHGWLLRKAWITWLKLRDEAPRIELHLISTWAWDPNDPLAKHLRDERLTKDFIEGIAAGPAAEVRAKWQAYLDPPASEESFQNFLASLRVHTGYPATSSLMKLVTERMWSRGLKDDEDSAWRGARAIREWMVAGQKEITEVELDEAIERLDLRNVVVDPAVTLWVHTIVKEMDTGAEYELDWRDLFEGTSDERGHQLLDADDWNGRLLPELRAKAARITRETDARLLRVRGKARLSVWFAVGYVFRQTTGWTLEADHYGSLWRTDTPRSAMPLETTVAELPGPSSAAAVAVSITGDAIPAVLRHLKVVDDPVSRLIHVRVEDPGRESITSAGDLIAVADAIRAAVLGLDPRPDQVHLFYFGPASGAVFIGHALNGLAREVRLFEESLGRYLPSIVLS